jgi:hypothetical protein
MKTLTALFLLFSASSCYHAALTPAADKVVLLQLRQPQNCLPLGSLEGVASGSLGFGDVLDTDAQNDLRQQSAQRGATHVVLTEMAPSAHESRAYGDAYRCGPTAVLR